MLRTLTQNPAVDAPFALTFHQANTERLYCLNLPAQKAGLHKHMGLADARALCPDLQTRPASPHDDRRFIETLARWARRYCPWVGLEGHNGLVLDITGAAHLFGGEEAMLADMRSRLMRLGLSVEAGLADTRGGAFAVARYGGGIAPHGRTLEKIAPLPIACLRLDEGDVRALHQLGIKTVAALTKLPRASLARRFGPGLLSCLDQALGKKAEPLSPLAQPIRFSVSMTLAEPIGLVKDVMAVLAQLLTRLCAMLEKRQRGVRCLQLVVQRVDRENRHAELRLARPMRTPDRLLCLFARHVEQIDAGYGIDRIDLVANRVEELAPRQIDQTTKTTDTRLDDLITRLANRAGLENITRYLPRDSHIPEHEFSQAPAAFFAPANDWSGHRPRPLKLFRPEPLFISTPQLPQRFNWRRMELTTAYSAGPERIAPQWWHATSDWRSGLRDYWQVQTFQGRRLWLFHTPQKPAWFVHGEFA